jgi:hypothetical protein
MKFVKRKILLISALLLLSDIGSYAVFYAYRIPAGNLAYWVYLRGGNETEREEWALYYFYYPIYKIHRIFGAGRHDYDRGIDYNHINYGDG